MAEKTDEEIIEELGLEQNNNNQIEIGKDEQVDESLEPIDELSKDEDSPSDDNTPKEEEINQTIENEDYEEIPIQKKQSKLFKILIGVIASLSIILTIGIILFLTGFFDEEAKNTPQEKAKPIEINNTKDSVNIDEIDKNKLNKKLQLLTKTEIMNKEELEAEEKRIAEEKRQEEEAKQKAIDEEKRQEEEKIKQEKEALEKEKELLNQRQETIKKEQEEFIKFQEEIKKEFEIQKEQLLEEIEKQKNTSSNVNDINSTTETSLEINDIVNNTINNEQEETLEEKRENIDIAMSSNLFLPFINVATVKGNLYKSYLDKIETFDKKISLCRDSKNRIEVYFGPYSSTAERNKVFNSLVENGFKEAYLVDFTKEEYEKRCKY